MLYHNLIINARHLINVISKLESTINIYNAHTHPIINYKLELSVSLCVCVVRISINFDLSIKSEDIPVYVIIWLIQSIVSLNVILCLVGLRLYQYICNVSFLRVGELELVPFKNMKKNLFQMYSIQFCSVRRMSLL